MDRMTIKWNDSGFAFVSGWYGEDNHKGMQCFSPKEGDIIEAALKQAIYTIHMSRKTRNIDRIQQLLLDEDTFKEVKENWEGRW